MSDQLTLTSLVESADSPSPRNGQDSGPLPSSKEKSSAKKSSRRTSGQLWPTPKVSLRGDYPSERNRRTPDLASVVHLSTETFADSMEPDTTESICSQADFL